MTSHDKSLVQVCSSYKPHLNTSPFWTPTADFDLVEEIIEELPSLQEDFTTFLGHMETEEELKAEGAWNGGGKGCSRRCQW